MPPVGPDLLAEANSLGDEESGSTGSGAKTQEVHGPMVEEVIRRALYGGGEFAMNFTIKKNKRDEFIVVPGHKWGRNPRGTSAGPEPAKVMVVGKCLGEDEVNRGRHQIGTTGQFMFQVLQRLGIPGVGDWYVTNVLKTETLDPDASSLKAGWVNAQIHLLHQEIRLVKPDYILCLGADAVKAILGKSMTVSKMEGRVEEKTFSFARHHDERVDHNVLVMACDHPARVWRQPELTPKFERSLNRFYQLTKGHRWDKGEPDLDHRVIDNEKDLLKTLIEAEEKCDAEGFGRIIGVDAEWHGTHPTPPDDSSAYLRSIQISWASKAAACIVLRKQGGKPGFRRVRKIKRGGKVVRQLTYTGGIERCIGMLNIFFNGGYIGQHRFRPKRPAGHQFCADLEWLIPEGLDLRKIYDAPAEWWDCRKKGGLDTALMAHSYNETDDFTLTGQTVRYTEAPRYDVALKKWVDSYCKQHGLKNSELEGFGECPDEVFYPYACYDADVARRIALAHIRHLDCDEFGNNCWEPYWISLRAALPVLEIDMTGLKVDRKRMDLLTSTYIKARDDLAESIRQWAKWPDINFESRFEVAELLFGERYNGHEKNDDGSYRRRRPAGARVVGCLPLLTTGKRPKPWSEVMADKKEDENTASTNKQVLGQLCHESKKLRVCRKGKWVRKNCHVIINQIRDYRFTSHILKGVLRPPEIEQDSKGTWVYKEVNDDGDFDYVRGIGGSICYDDRVRTFISQLKETGRWASARPPLQNISKRRESDYKRILGDDYLYPLRSIFVADDDYVIVEADYKGAELFGMAIMSGDQTMIEHVQRNLLPEDHPNYYDIHSSIAVLAFGLPCEPTKAGLKALDKANLRIVAKSVIFGIAYGRGAKAIAIAAREEGVDVTQEEAQQVIDAVFAMYPMLVPFFEECRARAVKQEGDNREEDAPRFICGPYGRYRRFPMTDDRQVAGEMERQAQNFPIQGMIADAVSLAIRNIYDYREEHPEIDFKIVLQIHDSIIFLVRKNCLARFVDEVLPTAMVDGVPIVPCHLDGEPMKDAKTYTLGIDAEPFIYWGVNMMPDECMDSGFDPKYAGWKKLKGVKGAWVNPEAFAKKVWLAKDKKLHSVEEVLTTGA